MKEICTTKKMPCGLTKDGRLTPRSEFVIPHLHGDAPSGFRGLRTGTTYDEAAITYIGKEITAADILEKIPETEATPATKAVLDGFIEALSAFRIGNVITIQYADNATFTLRIERAVVRIAKPKKLP